MARPEKIKVVKRSSESRPVGSPQFELIALFQAFPINHFKWHRWSKVNRSVPKLEYVLDNDE